MATAVYDMSELTSLAVDDVDQPVIQDEDFPLYSGVIFKEERFLKQHVGKKLRRILDMNKKRVKKYVDSTLKECNIRNTSPARTEHMNAATQDMNLSSTVAQDINASPTAIENINASPSANQNTNASPAVFQGVSAGLQDIYLDMLLKLSACEIGCEGYPMWRNSAGEKMSAEQLCTFVDENITMCCYSSIVENKQLFDGTVASVLRKFLVRIVCLCLEKSPIVPSEEAWQTGSCKVRVRVIISFLTAIGMLAYLNDYKPQKPMLSLKISGIDRNHLKGWIEDMLKNLEISPSPSSIDYALKTCFFRVNNDGKRIDKRQKESTENRKKELDVILPKELTTAGMEEEIALTYCAPLIVQSRYEQTQTQTYKYLLSATYHDKQDQLFGSTFSDLRLEDCKPESGRKWILPESCPRRTVTFEEFVEIFNKRVTKFIWTQYTDKSDEEWLKELLEILKSVSILRLESQWTIKNDLCSTDDVKQFQNHLIVIVMFMSAVAVVYDRIKWKSSHTAPTPSSNREYTPSSNPTRDGIGRNAESTSVRRGLLFCCCRLHY